MKKEMTREEMKAEMKRLGSVIGMLEIKRGLGHADGSIKELRKAKREFYQLSKIYKKKYYSLL